MRVIQINEAEAIFAPFFDGGDSDMRTDKASLLDRFDSRIGAGCRARVTQDWSSVNVEIDQAPTDVPAVTMTCREPLAIDGYDVFRLFAGVPAHVRVRIVGEQAGREVVILDGAAGNGSHVELDGTLRGANLDAFTLVFSLSEPRPARIVLRWLGLSNRAAQDRMEARPSPYTPDWPDCLKPETATEDTVFTPRIGILFDDAGLAKLRAQSVSGSLKPMCDALRKRAEAHMTIVPEAMVGEFIPMRDSRWMRARDLWMQPLYDAMPTLGLIGLIDRNPAMLRMAARMALAVAHCRHWCEGPMGSHPGATWHHRSFMESWYAGACGLILDWAGSILTPHGRQIIEDAIVMKGLPRIESDFKRMEYIRHMNQGVFFCYGRVFGLLGLIPSYPRYATQLEEAEGDLRDIVERYLQSDGIALEGPKYWAETAHNALSCFFALARFRGQAFGDYATGKLRRSADAALSYLSTRGAGTGIVGINDAHNQAPCRVGMAAAYALMTDDPAWRRLVAALVAEDEADLFSLILASAGGLLLGADNAVADPHAGRRSPPRFSHFPVGGQAASVRQDPVLDAVHLHLCSGPTFPAHFHEDKGSIVIEAAGQPLVIDRGVLSYDRTENVFLHSAAAHSLLFPESSDPSAPYHQPVRRPAAPGDTPWGVFDVERAYGAKLGRAVAEEDLLLLVSDQAGAWPEGLFDTHIRRICSPSPRLFIIEDVIETATPLAMSFRLHTPQPAEVRDDEAWIRAPGVALRVAAAGWSPSIVAADPCGIDDHDRPVNLVRLVSAPAKGHRLLTVLELLPTRDGRIDNRAPRWRIEAVPGGVRATDDGMLVDYRMEAGNAASVCLVTADVERRFCCRKDWCAT